jgi:UDP-glucose 4-epimerase
VGATIVLYLADGMQLYHPTSKRSDRQKDGSLGDTQITVTGGAGRLGRFVTAALAGRGQVTVVDMGAPTEGSDASAFRRADIRSLDQCLAALEGGEVLVHLAGIDGSVPATSETFFHVNVVGTCNVLEAARHHGYRKVLVCSSVAVFGFDRAHPGNMPRALPVTEDHPRMASAPYGLSKVLAEDAAAAFWRRTEIPTACMRPAYVLFPSLREPVIRRACGQAVDIDGMADPQLRQALQEPLPLLGAYIFPEDVARAAAGLAGADWQGFRTYVLAAADVLGPRATRDYLSAAYGDRPIEVAASYDDDGSATIFDLSAARRDFGWTPQYGWRQISVTGGITVPFT